jgi:hypothetical protein
MDGREKVSQVPVQAGCGPGMQPFPMIYVMKYSDHKYILVPSD